MTELDRTCILVAENDVLIRNFISTILSSEGYLILAAADDAESLDLSRTFVGEIRLLVTKSRELAGTILRERHEIRVILLSASTCAELKEIVRTVDPGAYLQHAALPHKLRDGIQRALSDANFGDPLVEV